MPKFTTEVIRLTELNTTLPDIPLTEVLPSPDTKNARVNLGIPKDLESAVEVDCTYAGTHESDTTTFEFTATMRLGIVIDREDGDDDEEKLRQALIAYTVGIVHPRVATIIQSVAYHMHYAEPIFPVDVPSTESAARMTQPEASV